MKTVEIIFYITLVLGLIVIVGLCLSKSNYNGTVPASHHNKTQSFNWCNDLGGTMKK